MYDNSTRHTCKLARVFYLLVLLENLQSVKSNQNNSFLGMINVIKLALNCYPCWLQGNSLHMTGCECGGSFTCSQFPYLYDFKDVHLNNYGCRLERWKNIWWRFGYYFSNVLYNYLRLWNSHYKRLLRVKKNFIFEFLLLQSRHWYSGRKNEQIFGYHNFIPSCYSSVFFGESRKKK